MSFDNILDLKQYSVIQICILCLAFVFYWEHLKLNSVSQFWVQNNMLEGLEKTPDILLTLHRMVIVWHSQTRLFREPKCLSCQLISSTNQNYLIHNQNLYQWSFQQGSDWTNGWYKGSGLGKCSGGLKTRLAVSRPTLQKHYVHLEGLPLPNFFKIKSLILIRSIEPIVAGPAGGPVYVCTFLGWAVGRVKKKIQSSPQQQAHTGRICDRWWLMMTGILIVRGWYLPHHIVQQYSYLHLSPVVLSGCWIKPKWLPASCTNPGTLPQRSVGTWSLCAIRFVCCLLTSFIIF